MICARRCRRMTWVYSVGLINEWPRGSKSASSSSSSSRLAGSLVSVCASEIEVGRPTSKALVLVRSETLVTVIRALSQSSLVPVQMIHHSPGSSTQFYFTFIHQVKDGPVTIETKLESRS